jgi:hypothetical protein
MLQYLDGRQPWEEIMERERVWYWPVEKFKEWVPTVKGMMVRGHNLPGQEWVPLSEGYIRSRVLSSRLVQYSPPLLAFKLHGLVAWWVWEYQVQTLQIMWFLQLHSPTREMKSWAGSESSEACIPVYVGCQVGLTTQAQAFWITWFSQPPPP